LGILIEDKSKNKITYANRVGALRRRNFEGETSNRLFQTLEEWNEFLKKYAPFFKEVA